MKTVEELAALVHGEVRGDRSLGIRQAQPLHQAGPQDISFVANEKNLSRLRTTGAGAVVIGHDLLDRLDLDFLPPALLLVSDPQAAFLQIAQTLSTRRQSAATGVSHHAYVHPTACIGRNTNVHAGASVGENAVIGDDCDIHPGVVIGAGSTIGNNVVLYPNVVLYDGVVVGNGVIIHASAVIGADGFGYRLVEGRHSKIRHHGTVRIEDDVEIGACTTIDRAMVGATVIGQGTKLDNLVMIAHNCVIGRHNIFVSQVGLAGSVTTGEYVVCAGQVGVADHVRLGDHCVVGAKSGVHKDMPGHQRYLGAPAAPEDETMRGFMATRKLPELRKQVRRLEHEVAELTAKLNSLLSEQPLAARPAA